MQNVLVIIGLLALGLSPIAALIYFQTRNVEKQADRIRRRFNLVETQDMGRVSYDHHVIGMVDTRLYKGKTSDAKTVYIVDIKSELRVVGQYRHRYGQITRQQALKLSPMKSTT